MISSSRRWLRVPVGDQSSMWSTISQARTVLAVAHTVTSTTRLLDVLSLLDGDTRIQVLFSEIPASAFDDGLNAFLDDIEAKIIRWDQATRTRFDLAICTGSSGPLHAINAPLLIMPHGAGYNKYLAGNREPGTGNREPGTRKAIYGLAREQLLHEGKLIPSTIVLSHSEQLDRLSSECPEAVPRALVAGDLCFDRLVASLPWRDDYRAALDVGPGQRLIVVTSTWGQGSLLGRRPELFARLLAELPVDEYRVAAVVHPNVWHGHGPWQLRAWLSDCRRAGLVMVPPREGWRATLVAADCVVGDHGSVTLYGAALGRPVLLGSFAHEDIDPATAMAELGRRAPRIRDDRPIREQIEHAVAGHSPGQGEAVAGRVFAARGKAAEILREAMYGLMGLPPPVTPVRVPPVPPPVPEPRAWDHAERPALVVTASIEETPGGVVVRVERYAAELDDLRSWSLPNPHLVVDGTEPDPRMRGLADVIVHRFDARRTSRLGGEDSTRIVAEVTADGTCHVRLPGGPVLRLQAEGPGGRLDPGTFASAVHAWVESGRPAGDFPAALTVVAGSTGALIRSRPPSG